MERQVMQMARFTYGNSTGQQLVILKGHSGWIWSIAFSPDGKPLPVAVLTPR